MLIIDRFEEEIAVCEDDGGMTEIPRELIDPAAREGDVLVKSGHI